MTLIAAISIRKREGPAGETERARERAGHGRCCADIAVLVQLLSVLKQEPAPGRRLRRRRRGHVPGVAADVTPLCPLVLLAALSRSDVWRVS